MKMFEGKERKIGKQKDWSGKQKQKTTENM